MPWRPISVDFPVDMLLLGPQNGLTAGEFADRSENLMWASTRVVDGPHMSLLRTCAVAPNPSDSLILESSYAKMARTVIRLTGNFFTARDDAGIIEVAHRYLQMAERPELGLAEKGYDTARTPAGWHVRVSRIKNSRYCQVNDGHHRVALAAFRGDRSIKVRKSWLAVTTPLQDLLDSMSWIGGARELYQPIAAPELEAWTTVRRCDDRRDKMIGFLHDRYGTEGMTYLDVACAYGWFVSEMTMAGYESVGVERDPLARQLASAVYRIPQERIQIADAVEFLERRGQTWDVVSCLSLLHHFVLGRANATPETLMKLLDAATGRVLFLDTGQEHEEWFRTSLRGWDSERIKQFLRANTTFDDFIDLGPDLDAVPPHQFNYGRHLFACVRSGS